MTYKTSYPHSGIRAKRDAKQWIVRLFLIALFSQLSGSFLHAQVIDRAEYFFDVDPGNGNGTPVTVPAPSANVSFTANISTASLAPGFHVLGFRIRQSVTGQWSPPNHRYFYIIPPTSVVQATNLVAGEYFFDVDPGLGSGTAFPFTASSSVSQLITNINLSALSPGFHTINTRFKDDRGRWSHTLRQSFYIIPDNTANLASTITRAEYFFDTDPGNGNGTALPLTANANQSNSFAISLPGSLTQDFHRVGFRYKDNLGKWSHAEYRSFYVLPLAQPPASIVAAQYFIDDVNGTGTPTNIAGITPGATLDQLIALDMTGVPTGNHTLSIRVKDTRGYWSYLNTQNFTVSACTPPPSPTVANTNRCGPGTVTLTATGASGAQEYRWYDDPILNNLVFTGPSFTTPSLSASKNYYVSIYDPVTACESSRITVQAIITILPKPLINPSGTISFCEGGFVFLSAPAGFAQYAWSSGQTTQQILVNTSGNYSVQTGDGTCLSEVSDAVSVTVIPAPVKPTITVTGSTTICGSGSVDLTGPAGFEYAWSNGATTQTITVNATGVYFLIIKTTGASCPSFPSDPVVVSVLTPPCGGGNPTNEPPVISTAPLATQIEGTVQVDLTQAVSDPNNNLDFSTLRVVNNETSRGVQAFIDGSYFLQIDYSGTPFTGVDRVTIEVCDLNGLCVQQVIDIEVVGEIVVYNGLTPDGDGYNDYLLIKYVGVVEGSAENTVKIFNRWGAVVYEATNYDNQSVLFDGTTADGKELPTGTYFYTIRLGNGNTYSGYITLKR